MGFTVGKITEDHKHQNMKWYVIAIAAACVIKVVGYYIAEVIIYGNPVWLLSLLFLETWYRLVLLQLSFS